ncbi:MAG: hypothetical protein H0X25_08880 [Acidobacteriales bacterium]|nr:hypothetical protein [Terriglobales bacterium]
MTHTPGDPAVEKVIYVTLTGLPLSIELKWPFHRSTSGADFWVLHSDIRLENSGGLHAPVAVNLSATVREVVPSLEAHDLQAPIINALRKEVDRKQVEFVKSGKLVPMNFSSRHWNFRRNQWVFGSASDEEISRLIMRKVYWQTRLVGGDVWIGDETEAMYVDSTTDHLVELAKPLVEQGWFRMDRRWATASPELMNKGSEFEADVQHAREELDKKHAYERG